MKTSFFGHRFDVWIAIRLSCTVFRKADREQTFNPDVYWAPITHYCRLLINVVPQRYRARICCSDLMIFEGCDNWLDHQGAIADIANRVRATDPREEQDGISLSSIIRHPTNDNFVCLFVCADLLPQKYIMGQTVALDHSRNQFSLFGRYRTYIKI